METLFLYGKQSAKYWEFVGVIFHDENVVNKVMPIISRNATIWCKDICGLSKYSDDSPINIVDPCYIDSRCLYVDGRPRKPVIFGKIGYDQGLYHSCCNNINTNTVKLDQNKSISIKRSVNPIKVANVRQVLEYQHSPSRNVYHLFINKLWLFIDNNIDDG